MMQMIDNDLLHRSVEQPLVPPNGIHPPSTNLSKNGDFSITPLLQDLRPSLHTSSNRQRAENSDG
jgi:hypothetical protein